MKKTLSLLLCTVIIALCLTSCSGSVGKNVSMYDLSKAMTEASEKLPSMAYASSEDENAQEKLEKAIDTIDSKKIKSFFISYAEDAAGYSDEIIVMSVKDKNYIDILAGLLSRHVAYRVSLYTTYKPAQVPKLSNSRIFTYKQYVVLIVADESALIEDAFYEFMK